MKNVSKFKRILSGDKQKKEKSVRVEVESTKKSSQGKANAKPVAAATTAAAKTTAAAAAAAALAASKLTQHATKDASARANFAATESAKKSEPETREASQTGKDEGEFYLVQNGSHYLLSNYSQTSQ